ncbi:MAG: hypothetical protein NT001_04275, partial [Candidatus Woesearchaeota archaeon]|nr:hypothetical protein [Candidatus Woesearchaeota archaeon]
VWGFDEYMAMVPIIIDSENSEETRKEALDCFNELKDVLKGKQKILQTIPRFKEKFSGVLDMSPEEIYNHVINIVKERDNEK